MQKILIKNGRIWDGEKFFYGDVLTNNEKIAKIALKITEDADFVYDAKGKTVSAGLVDAHVHLKGISPDIFGINAEMCTFPFGATACVDACADQGSRELLDSFGVKARIFVPAHFSNNKADFTKALEMLEIYGDKAIGIKVYYDVHLSEIEDVTPLKEVVEFAEKHNLRVMVHSSNSPISMAELLSVLRKGDTFTHAYHGGENNTADDNYECIKEAKARGVIVDAGLAGYVHTNFEIFKNAIKSGAQPEVISTDITKCSAFKRGGNYGLTMCMSIARDLGMSEADIFKCVTLSAARSMGMENEWGILAEGRTADIAVLEYSKEKYDMTDKAGRRIRSNKGYKNVLTLSNGEIVYRK